jgi:hypothetical protein
MVLFNDLTLSATIKHTLGLHVKCLVFLDDFNQSWTFIGSFIKASNIKIDRNPSSGIRADTVRLCEHA